MYSEQVGTKRQAGRKNGETSRWYAFISRISSVFTGASIGYKKRRDRHPLHLTTSNANPGCRCGILSASRLYRAIVSRGAWPYNAFQPSGNRTPSGSGGVFPVTLFLDEESAPLEKSKHQAFDLRVLQVPYSCPGDEKNIVSLLEGVLVETEGFSQEPFYPVSHNRSADFPADAHPQPRYPVGYISRRGRAEKQRECRGHHLLPLGIGAVKVPFPAKPFRARESEFPHGYTARRFLPFCLLRLITSRPQRVLILFLKPWVRLRLIFDGWYVLLTNGLSFLLQRLSSSIMPGQLPPLLAEHILSFREPLCQGA
jgi:hypothetical protein